MAVVRDSRETTGIVPKIETCANVLHEQGIFGENTIVAILDTGCDPGSEGLRQCPDGSVKFVDVVDATGTGDVDMTTSVKMTDDREIELASGRKVKVPESWECPTGEFRVGTIALFDVIPSTCKKRLLNQRRKKFDLDQQRLEAELRSKVNKAQEKVDNLIDKEGLKAAKKELEETKNQLEQLTSHASVPDVGPVYDCLCWHTGVEFLGCVITESELEKCKPMTNYRVRHEYAKFSKESLLNYVLNIYDEGKVLCVVTHQGSHGTHVAGIVGAYYGAGNQLNGVAPGCKLVSIKIGDGRLGTMETTSSLIRALRVVVENKCDLVNLSYGEATNSPNFGRLNELLQVLVDKYGIIFFSSAGNNGPNFNSIGAPGGTCDALISVGALVTPNMVKSCLSRTQTVEEIKPFTWSSRGPCWDASRGVDICAPGGAITSVPQSTLSRNQYMNGTSMASPNCCGTTALLLSYLKKQGVKYTPHSVRRVIENSAVQLKHLSPLEIGCGMINVQAAMEMFEKAQNDIQKLDMKFKATVGGKPGLLLRNATQVFTEDNERRYLVFVRPMFHEDEDTERQVEFQVDCKISCNAEWVQTPDFFLLNRQGRSFEFKLDISGLATGYHYTEVQGFSINHPELGPLFRFPVTIMVPQNESLISGELVCENHEAQRIFVNPPKGATILNLELENLESNQSNRVFWVNAMYNNDQTPVHQDTEIWRALDTSTFKISFEVEENNTVELVIAQYCLSFPTGTRVRYKITYTGLEIQPRNIVLEGNSGVTEFQVKSGLKIETFEPSCSLTHATMFISPTNPTITKLDSRDIDIQNKQIQMLNLHYTFETPVKGTFEPFFPKVDGFLYGALISTGWMLFDSNNKLLKTGDNWDKHDISLNKQSGYKIILKICSEDTKVLESLKNIRCHLIYKLSKSIPLDVHRKKQQAILKRKPTKSLQMRPGACVDFYLASPDEKLIPTWAKPGTILTGKFLSEKSKKEARLKRKYKVAPGGKGERAICVPITYTVPVKIVEPKKKDETPKKEPNLLPDMIPGLLEVVKNLDKKLQLTAFERFAEPLLKEVQEGSVEALNILKLRVELVEKEKFDEIVQRTDAIINQINLAELAAHFGLNQPPNPTKEQKMLHEKMTKTKEILTTCLKKKLSALISINKEKDNRAELEKCESVCLQWMKADDKELRASKKALDTLDKRIGGVLKQITKELAPAKGDKEKAKAAPSKTLQKERLECVQELGWTHIGERLANVMRIDYPAHVRLF